MIEFLTELWHSIPPGFTFGIADIDYVRFTSDYRGHPQKLIPIQRGYYQLDNKVTAAQQAIYYCKQIAYDSYPTKNIHYMFLQSREKSNKVKNIT